MAKQIFFDIEARNKMKKGVDTLSNAVKVTLGPKGRNVVIEKKFGAPAVTKDGVTVAKEIELEDPIEKKWLPRLQISRATEPPPLLCWRNPSSAKVSKW